ncbi:MAG: hypothetical protein ACFFBD_02265, partial [Candidatus Hodarchaeota archaeon]
LALSFSLLVVIIDQFLKIVSENKLGLAPLSVLQGLCFIVVVYFSVPIIRRFIKVPRSRKQRFERLLLTIRTISIILFFASLFLIIETNQTIVNIFLIGVLTFVLILSIFIIILLIREYRDNASKLMRIRLEMFSLGWLGLLGYFIVALILLTLEFLIFTEGWSYPILLLCLFIFRFTTVISVFGFYWSYFPPNWMRRRHNMLSPSLLRSFGDSG